MAQWAESSNRAEALVHIQGDLSKFSACMWVRNDYFTRLLFRKFTSSFSICFQHRNWNENSFNSFDQWHKSDFETDLRLRNKFQIQRNSPNAISRFYRARMHWMAHMQFSTTKSDTCQCVIRTKPIEIASNSCMCRMHYANRLNDCSSSPKYSVEVHVCSS